jgi:microcystin-dependent protein
MLFSGNFCPTGWIQTSGQLMSISQNTALFSILGTTYGGDGKTTFALPKLEGPKAPGAPAGTVLRWCIALFGVYPSRS